jgi:hypothetical protein
MKTAQIESVPSDAPVIPSTNAEAPMQAGIGSVAILMLMIVFARLILGQPPANP